MTESDTHSTRESNARESTAASTRADGRDYVLPAVPPQARAGVDGRAPTPAPDAADASWRELFAAPSSSQILRRILEGDPLRIEERCRERIERGALLVDLERVVQCVLANVAYFARRYRGSPEFEAWMRQRVEAGLERVLEDEQELDRTLRSFEPPIALHVRVGALLGMNPRLVRPALVVFNSLPLKVRRVFCAVVMDARPLASLPEEQFGAADVRERRLNCALASIGGLRAMGVQLDDGGLDEE